MRNRHILLLIALWIGLIAGGSFPANAQISCNGSSCAADGTVSSLASLQSQITAVQTQQNNSTQYLTGFTNNSPGLLANLYANSPCNNLIASKYAVVSDLYSSVTEVMRCTYFGSPFGYGWRAQRADFAANLFVGNSNFTINCNVTAPSLALSGTLTSNISVTLNTTNCTPGQRQEIVNNSLAGIYSMTVTGLTGTVTSKILAGATTSTFIFDGTGWRAY